MIKTFLDEIKHIKKRLFETKVLENYVFMTALNLISSLIGLFLYPYVIRTIGTESYGLYVFALSISGYFSTFIQFGFDLPATRTVVENKENKETLNNIVSSIFTSRLLLLLISISIFIPLLLLIPIIENNKLLFSIAFLQVISNILFPTWYFQGIKNMKIVTYINLTFRILMIPAVFLLIHNSSDNLTYMLITTASILLGSISASLWMYIKDEIRIKLIPINTLKSYFKNGTPFFWTSIAGTIKENSITVIIGTCFGMTDVALYDLANKVVTLPRMFTQNINGALFPEIIGNALKDRIKRILKYESIIGISIMLGIIFFGYWVILLLGGERMTSSYPLSIILSTTIPTYLIVGAFLNLIFVSKNRYYFITQNQIIALISCLLFCLVGLFITKSIFIMAGAIAFSGICELVHCIMLTKKHKYL